MPAPVEFMKRYRNLRVKGKVVDDPIAKVCREGAYQVQLRKYFGSLWIPDW